MLYNNYGHASVSSFLRSGLSLSPAFSFTTSLGVMPRLFISCKLYFTWVVRFAGGGGRLISPVVGAVALLNLILGSGLFRKLTEQ